jgi:hypothetical protein
MAAFTFEKISPSARGEAVPAAIETRPRNAVVKAFSRVAGKRARRETQARADNGLDKPAQD